MNYMIGPLRNWQSVLGRERAALGLKSDEEKFPFGQGPAPLLGGLARVVVVFWGIVLRILPFLDLSAKNSLTCMLLLKTVSSLSSCFHSACWRTFVLHPVVCCCEEQGWFSCTV